MTEGLYQPDPRTADGIKSNNMQSSKVDLGHHASIAVREWKLLQNTVTTMTAMSVDTDYLGVAKITAVSK